MSEAARAGAETEEERPRIAICIPTYRRRQGLFALLGALEQQVFGGETPDLRIFVIDNDHRESARDVYESASRWMSYPLRYSVEKRKGIPQARNAALSAALGEADWIVFVDDDELPEPHWLAELLRVQRACEADVVTGPSVPRFAKPPPAWVLEGGFFDQRRYATGQRLESAFTNNVLLRARALEDLDRFFDERITLGVGEDTELFRRLASGGCRIVWADEAVVHDQVPAERVRISWIVRRSYRVGAVSAHNECVRRSRSAAAPRLIAHGGWCIARGLARAGVGLRRGRAVQVDGLRLAAYGLGRWLGLFGELVQ